MRSNIKVNDGDQGLRSRIEIKDLVQGLRSRIGVKDRDQGLRNEFKGEGQRWSSRIENEDGGQ